MDDVAGEAADGGEAFDLEAPGPFHCERGLPGEGLQDLRVVGREEAGGGAFEVQHAEHGLAAQQGDGKLALHFLAQIAAVTRLGVDVRNVVGRAAAQHFAADRFGNADAGAYRLAAGRRDDDQLVPVQLEQLAEIRRAEQQRFVEERPQGRAVACEQRGAEIFAAAFAQLRQACGLVLGEAFFTQRLDVQDAKDRGPVAVPKGRGELGAYALFLALEHALVAGPVGSARGEPGRTPLPAALDDEVR